MLEIIEERNGWNISPAGNDILSAAPDRNRGVALSVCIRRARASVTFGADRLAQNRVLSHIFYSCMLQAAAQGMKEPSGATVFGANVLPALTNVNPMPQSISGTLSTFAGPFVNQVGCASAGS